jgi:hypothetical protein
MKPTISLKLSAVAFTILWFGGMLWVSGADDSSTIVTLALCCVATGYAWYRLMHWSFRHMSLLPFGGMNRGAG